MLDAVPLQGLEARGRVNPIDHTLVGALQSIAHHSRTFDATIVFIDHNDLTKGGVIMAIVWWAWFRRVGSTHRHNHEAILSALAGGFVSILVGHALAHVLPFRLRPMHEPSLHFVMPYGASRHQLKLWSSFPSQHTLFFSALAVGMMYVELAAGIYILIHLFLFVAVPRMYLGFHYPTDILGGVVIGTVVAMAMQHPRVRRLYAPRLIGWQSRHRGLFFALFFLVTLQLSSMFQGAIDLLKLFVFGPPT